MNSQTPRITSAQWEARKGAILSLFCQNGYTLRKVKDFMKNEHNFGASISQYEAQLRAWNVRKNLSTDEWITLIENVDKLDSQGIKSRIIISGDPVGENKLRRMRRRHQNGKHRRYGQTTKGHLTELESVAIEIRGTDGNWTPQFSRRQIIHHSQNEADGQLPSLTTSMPDNQSFGAMAQQSFGEIELVDAADRHQLELSDESGLQSNTGFAAGGTFSPTSFDVSSLMALNDLQTSGDYNYDFFSPGSNWARTPSLSYTFSPFRLPLDEDLSSILDASPFKHFMRSLGILGFNTMNASLNSRGTASLIGQDSLRHLEDDIHFYLAKENGNIGEKTISDVACVLTSLGNQLSNTKLHGVYTKEESLMTKDEMLQVKLFERLLFSTANGFVGLEGIPIQYVLKFLHRPGNIQLLLRTSHTHVEKSLAENLLRAAIEGQDKDALQSLLASSSIDVNSITCIVGGYKYTPIERAAYMRDLAMVEILLREKADINKTYDINGGPLARLIQPHPLESRSPTSTENIFAIAELLLDHGAKLYPRFFKSVFAMQIPQPDVQSLISRMPDADHAKLIQEGILTDIVIHLGDWSASAAIQAIKNIIIACENSNCGKCKKDFEAKFDWALIQAAKYGRLELVGLLLLYTKTPHRALSAAIRSGSSDIISIIMTLNPDINAPGHNIDEELYSVDLHGTFDSYTTSYAEAIRMKNENLILDMETKGALSLLHERSRFEPAITAASEIGDLFCARKLLNHCMSPEPSSMTNALLRAVRNGNEELSMILLEAGADVNLPEQFQEPDPLFFSVSSKNPRMVKAILDADHYVGDRYYWKSYSYNGAHTSVMEQAILWGDRDIIQDLQLACPHFLGDSENYQFILDSVDTALLEFLFEIEVFSIEALTALLKIALAQGNGKLVEQLLERGADPTDSSVLVMCLAKCPGIIYERMSFRNGNRMSNFGTTALVNAIRKGQSGVHEVKLLLETGFVDATRLPNSHYQVSPLGEAILIVHKCHQTCLEVVKSLLGYGCDPNSIVHNNDYFDIKHTALLEAIQTRRRRLVELLIDEGADVNREARLGLKRTPLQKATEEDSLEIVTLLLERGADPNAAPAQRGGATAFQLAAIRGNCIIATELLKWGAKPDAPPGTVNGRWPLEGAAEHGRMEMIYFLWMLNRGCLNAEICQKAIKRAEENGFMACKNAIEDLSQQPMGALFPVEQV
ncbi:hypothetical protein HYFRA_00001458 [Hymenoscyphus fraxineus]|uniref:Clr5 domain-containing protein n=1 Tax=Hymenoscyphus fraxineus TaxID=746836 RepID=A0A9N9PZB9_9HELO|nr:hypothetical protein HYFRA_00001458 [Hymenoscyphus fraxineus]